MSFEIRLNRSKPQGPKGLSAERAEYFRLMSMGFGPAQAARAVGVSKRTGKNWRNGYPPSQRLLLRGRPRLGPLPDPDARARTLSQSERVWIADRLHQQVSLRTIAKELGRSPSTISRELARNSGDRSGHYGPYAAQGKAMAALARPKAGKLATNPALREQVQAGLELEWSPEQISHSLRMQFPDQPEMQVSHETIYQALYVQGRGELRRELAIALRTGRTKRKPHRHPQQRQTRFIEPMVMISERPPEVEDRAVPGHWEGDLIIGKDGKSQIGTLVERASRFLMLIHLPTDRTAETVRDALAATMATLPEQMRKTLTWDQGVEMALHHQFKAATDMPVYFCDPHSPWQRGSNENTNGLLRQYFPKGTDLSIHSPEHLAFIAAKLNGRPRKTLDWKNPSEHLENLLATAS